MALHGFLSIIVLIASRPRNCFFAAWAATAESRGARSGWSRHLIFGGVVLLCVSGTLAGSCPNLFSVLPEDDSDTVRSGESDSHDFLFDQMLLRSRMHHNNGEHFVNAKGQRRRSRRQSYPRISRFLADGDFSAETVHAIGCAAAKRARWKPEGACKSHICFQR